MSETLTLQPAAGIDTWITPGSPTNNYGTDDAMSAGKGASANARGLLKFDLSSLPIGGISLVSATLTLRCTAESSTTDYVVGVHRSLVPWFEGIQDTNPPAASEDGSTWNLRNANGSVAWVGGAGGASGLDWEATATDSQTITSDSADFNYNVLADIIAWRTSQENYGWWIINTSPTVTNSRKTFATSDHATEAYRPKLVIVYNYVNKYYVEVDWDLDGNYTDETAHVKDFLVRRGRKEAISSDRYADVKAGELSATLNNHTGRFDFFNTASPLYGYLLPNRPMRVRFDDGSQIYSLFTGKLSDLRPQTQQGIARIEAKDGIDYLQNTPAGLGDLQTDYTVTEAILALLTAAGWPYTDTSGWTFSTQLGIDSYLGSSLIDSNGDSMAYWWSDDNLSTMQAINEIAHSFAGDAYVAADGTFAYQVRGMGGVSKFTVTDDDIGADAEIQQPWEEIRNYVKVTGHPRNLTASGDIWRLYETPSIAPADSLTLWADFWVENATGPATSITTPAKTTDYSANDQEDGSGTDRSTLMTIVMTKYAASAKLVITNGNAGTVYLTLMKLRGVLAADTNPVSTISSNSTSQTAYSKRRLALDCRWLQTTADINDHAGHALAVYQNPRKVLNLKIRNRPAWQFGVDLFDQITLDLEHWSATLDYRITAIDHQGYKGKRCETTLRLEPQPGAAAGYWVFSTALGETSILGW